MEYMRLDLGGGGGGGGFVSWAKFPIEVTHYNERFRIEILIGACS